jgi:transcriptional regulator
VADRTGRRPPAAPDGPHHRLSRTVTASDARFKLGQEENLPELLEILSGHADPALVGWMRRLNADRLHEQVAPHGDQTTG